MRTADEIKDKITELDLMIRNGLNKEDTRKLNAVIKNLAWVLEKRKRD